MDDVLREQLAYYRARAPDFDASVRASSPPSGSHLLQRLGPFQHVLELACGTGIWTQELLSIGHEVTALDAVPLAATFRACKALLAGAYDEIPEDAFM